MPFSAVLPSAWSTSSLYGAVSAEGSNAPERSARNPLHLGHVEVLQGGAGGGKGKQASLTHLVTTSYRELAKTREGTAEGGQAGQVGTFASMENQNHGQCPGVL